MNASDHQKIATITTAVTEATEDQSRCRPFPQWS